MLATRCTSHLSASSRWRCGAALLRSTVSNALIFANDAIARGAVAPGIVGCRRAIRRVDRDIDVMPASCLWALRSDFIGPS
jgi:hypothetical protein